MGDLDRIKDIYQPVRSFNLFSGIENNYPTSVRLTFCGNNAQSQQGEITMTKSIQGNDYLYIIKMIKRLDAFTTEETSYQSKKLPNGLNTLVTLASAMTPPSNSR